MRTFSVIMSGVLVAAVSACSRPADPLPPPDGDALIGARDLALPSMPGDHDPVASELEAPRPPQPEHTPRRSAPPRIAAAPLGSPAPAAGVPTGVLPASADVTIHPDDAGEEPAVAGPGPVAAVDGGPARSGGSRAGGAIIIRGGDAGVDDDCAAHRRPPDDPIATRPETHTLINDRVQRRGPPQSPRPDRTRSPVSGRIGIR